MKDNKIQSFRKGDFLAIGIVLILAVLVFFLFGELTASQQACEIQIYQKGELIHRMSPDVDATYEVTGEYTNIIQVQNGKVAIVESDCPGQDCIHSGWIEQSGRSIVCLPNQVEIRIAGVQDVDFVVGCIR